MIKIEMPKPDLVIRQREQVLKPGDVEITPYFGFIDFHKITRDKGGIFFFYNEKNELLFVGKARKIRQRIKKHFEDNVSPMKNHRAEIHKIEVYEIEDPMEREIYETFAINQFQSKYNIDKVFFERA
ncbi:putative ferric reductase [Solibacillus kalamii]|uniref:Nuclease subunit of the excinuclease complex n=3 Tax=Solibacillus TaxID=648800 RepID=F2F9A5_SOLSS|nr:MULTISPECIES: nucleotide excision repair endonuclease [Solibacillus]AMO85454.1 nucleotide excision repair endonuclease [Solibacillus silvestris]EKB44511.1 Nuclease subunit of the excinuclease complex [Solibacillus isronensis B3W22]MBM7663675.1 putative ferric reductase [Solibacillus kalamii]OBW60538.1 nucleotide excision repair endonuclease [Solibacillus silvestris]OUZ39071.1 nucleotide excision repair endonuclease [Solibacillus kalamii]